MMGFLINVICRIINLTGSQLIMSKMSCSINAMSLSTELDNIISHLRSSD